LIRKTTRTSRNRDRRVELTLSHRRLAAEILKISLRTLQSKIKGFEIAE
jgi:hypothetical protein